MSHQVDEVFEHQHGKRQIGETSQGFWQTFIVTRQATETSGPAKRALHHPPSGQQHEAFLGLRQLDHCNSMPCCSAACAGTSRYSPDQQRPLPLIDRSPPAPGGRVLPPRRGPVRWRGSHTTPADGPTYRRRYAFCCPFCASPHHSRALTTFRRRLQGTAVKNRGAGLLFASFGQPQHCAQIMQNGLENPAPIQCWVCWYTLYQGGRSLGIIRHGAPARTIQRNPLKTSRKLCSRCGASSVIKVK